MSALYLVQTRGHGEPWSTQGALASLILAAKVADRYAAERFPYLYRSNTPAPIHAYVRVSLRGRTVYDPRDRSAVVAPDSRSACSQSTTAPVPTPLD